jgi:hypothetical protein
MRARALARTLKKGALRMNDSLWPRRRTGCINNHRWCIGVGLGQSFAALCKRRQSASYLDAHLGAID